MAKTLTIAIDGPVASGKSAVGRLVAERLGWLFLDTGMMYRAVTRVALERGVDFEDVDRLGNLAEALTFRLSPVRGLGRLMVDGKDITGHLRSPEVERGVSLVAKVPRVRREMVKRQRIIAGDGPIVMAGRDIGTVVLPDATTKIYLTASVDERARRRCRELTDGGEQVEYDQVHSDLERRDRIDSERAESPLRPAGDALVVDTDGLEIENVAQRIVSSIGQG